MAAHLTYILSLTSENRIMCRLMNPVFQKQGGFQFASFKDSARFMSSLSRLDFLTAQDRKIFMRLYMNQALHSTEIILSGRDGCDLLKEMIGTGRALFKGVRTALSWGLEKQGKLAWNRTGELQSPVILVEGDRSVVLPTVPPLYFNEGTAECGIVALDVSHAFLMRWTSAGAMASDAVKRFCSELLENFPDSPLPPSTVLGEKDLVGEEPKPVLEISHRIVEHTLFGYDALAIEMVRVFFEYEGIRVEHGVDPDVCKKVHGDTLYQVYRYKEKEIALLSQLESIGFKPVEVSLSDYRIEGSKYCYVLQSDIGTTWWDVLTKGFGELESQGWTVLFGDSGVMVPVREEDWYQELTASKRQKEVDWFGFEAGFLIEGQRVNLLPVVQAYLADRREVPSEEIQSHLSKDVLYVNLQDGRRAVLPGERVWAILEKLFELFDAKLKLSEGRLQLDAMRVAEIADFAALSEEEWQGLPSVGRLIEMLEKGIAIEPLEPPTSFKAALRDYQKMGLGWLQFLRVYGVGGILADDMGLGKTVQTLAHLATEKEAGRLNKPVLIVAPTSLMKNWRDEAKRFTPQLELQVIHGSERKKHFYCIQKVDIVVTTYPLLRIDRNQYETKAFSYIILDEAQNIKNPKSQAARVLCDLQSEHRLCLTGTPMENHLSELWSLYRFLMPGFLGSESLFKNRFRDPIEKSGDQALKKMLSRRLGPFMLRRKKDEVAKELPPKTEIIHRVELTEKQRELYEAVRLAVQEKVLSELKKRGLAKSQIVVLDALMKLRQVCCDPRLVDKNNETLTSADSAKLEALIERVTEMIEEGRRILVFSQFTSMLALIEKELKVHEIDFVKLTGSTQNREKPIEAFQRGEVPLFLISLKAGGVGLNLTTADTVIHFDPWWNPAAEDQATDRAYRIGQDKPVFVYKFFAEGTIEERIRLMQGQKKALADSILSGAVSDKIRFDESDIAALLGSA